VTTFADVSHHQPSVDLDTYKAAGHDRIVLKATEGARFTDSRFASRWQRAGQLGLARVAYCYAEAQDNGADDFDHLLAVVKAAGGLGPRDILCLDVEDVDDGAADYARAQIHVREFTGRAAALGYGQGLIYTGRWYANPAHVDPSDMPPGWRQLWISHYDTSVPDAQVLLPAGWTRAQVVARQYTDRASVAGVLGRCDDSRLLRDWLSSTAPSKEDDDVAKQDVIEALQEVFHLPDGGLAVPRGQSDNGRLAQILVGNTQEEHNTLGRIEGAVDAVKADTRLQGDDEAKILAALASAQSHASTVLSPASA
jgi:GH25 family lysozyme M1 (1,4-beta-N-acetylmuramidase)